MTMSNSITTESGEATFRRNGTLKISTGLTRFTGFQETENACPNRKECSIENPLNSLILQGFYRKPKPKRVPGSAFRVWTSLGLRLDDRFIFRVFGNSSHPLQQES